MIDTIILQIPKEHFIITNYLMFGTTNESIKNTKLAFAKWVNNPTKKDKTEGIYKPRLTLIKRGYKLFLKIEFSAPKLLFNNNIDELTQDDFNQVIKTLQGRIKEMGVTIWSHCLENADVITFHPSKNIPLTKNFTADLAIRELKKIDFSKRFDLNEKTFKNNGEVLQIYTNSHSFVVYDKINDLVKKPKRATDKDQTPEQLDIFEYLQKSKKQIEILRMEVRLSKRQKAKKLLENIGFKQDLIFKNIFNEDLCKKLVGYYWDNLFADNLFLYSVDNNPQSVLRLILSKYPRTKITTAIKLIGFYQLCRDDEGMRGFRQIVDSYKPKTNWQAVKRDMKLFQDKVFYNNNWSFIDDIQRELREFKPYKLNTTGYKRVDKPICYVKKSKV